MSARAAATRSVHPAEVQYHRGMIVKALLPLVLLLAPLAAPATAAGSAEELLAAAIAHHDPQGRWSQGAFLLTLVEERPGDADRRTRVLIDNATGRFEIDTERQGHEIHGSLDSAMDPVAGCTWRLDGREAVTPEERAALSLTCERLATLRNYYTYLWGLPMKLTDPRTRIAPRVRETTFEGEPARAIDVTYDPAVGSEGWTFYFDAEAPVLIGYAFERPVGDERPHEHVVLEETVTGAGLRLPAVRRWTVSEEGELLGIDRLVEIEDAYPQMGPPPPPPAETKPEVPAPQAVQEILALERRRLAAMVGADLPALRELLDDRLIYVHSNGGMDTKASLLSALGRKRLDYLAIEPGEPSVRIAGPWGAKAEVRGPARLRVAGPEGELTLELRYVATWERGPGGWKLIGYESKPAE